MTTDLTDDIDRMAALEARLAEAETMLQNFGNQLVALRAVTSMVVMSLDAVAPGTETMFRRSLDSIADGMDDADAARILRRILIDAPQDITAAPADQLRP
jgi:uncharacterized coiled-coil protein SlyX